MHAVSVYPAAFHLTVHRKQFGEVEIVEMGRVFGDVCDELIRESATSMPNPYRDFVIENRHEDRKLEFIRVSRTQILINNWCGQDLPHTPNRNKRITIATRVHRRQTFRFKYINRKLVAFFVNRRLVQEEDAFSLFFHFHSLSFCHVFIVFFSAFFPEIFVVYMCWWSLSRSDYEAID